MKELHFLFSSIEKWHEKQLKQNFLTIKNLGLADFIAYSNRKQISLLFV